MSGGQFFDSDRLPKRLKVEPTLGEMFVRAIERNGDLPALDDTRERLTYREFGIRVANVASILRAVGLTRGQGLAQLSLNRNDAVCVIAAAFLLGLRYTPLHPLSSVADHAFVINDAEIDCLVFDEQKFEAQAHSLTAQTSRPLTVFRLDELVTGNTRSTQPGQCVGTLVCDAQSEDIALIAYTGGTTGRPKGVVHRHHSLTANLLISMAEWDWGEPRRFLAVTPISHAAFLFILPVMLRGGLFCMLPSFSVADFTRVVRQNAITTTFLVPTMIYALLDQMASFQDLASLQCVIYGAAPISPHILREAITRIGPKFSQLYGQTEAPNAVTMLFKRHHDITVPGRLESCGVALAGDDVRLLGPDGREVCGGELGEICVRGPLVMDGYWKRPEETAAAFADGWLHTGDIARRDLDGFYFIVDRKKDVIITGGFNVYPREVEGAIYQHPSVAQCCVVGIPDEKWGEAVTAFVVLKDEKPATEDEIRALVKKKKGAVYAPKGVHFLEQLPLTALGKIDRKVIKQKFWHDTKRHVN